MGHLESATERIRQSSDIADVVGRFVSLKRTGKTLKGLCPFHAEKTPSFIVSPDRQIFKCFGCGAGGDVFKFVQLRENLSFPEAKRLLAEWAGIRLDDAAESDAVSSRTQIARINDWAAGVFIKYLNDPDAGAEARAYLQRRRIGPEAQTRFRLGLAPNRFDALLIAGRRAGVSQRDLETAGLVRVSTQGQVYDTFRHRLMFPIVDAAGRVVGFGGRALGDEPAKYVNSPETPLFSKGRVLYGLAEARQAFSASKRAVVVEGYTDCIMAHQSGLRDAIATLGTAFTDEHAQLLRRYVDTVVLVFDGDEAGQAAAGRALEAALASRLDVRIAVLPAGQDPCDLLLAKGPAALTERLNSACGALEFMWRHVEQTCGGEHNLAARRGVIDRFIETVCTLSAKRAVDEIDRGWFFGEIARLVGLPREEVQRYAARLAKRRARPSWVGAERIAAPPSEKRVEDPEQIVLREVLEVLLCDPALSESVGPCWSAQVIRDPRLRQVAEALAECLARDGQATLSDVLLKLETPEAAGLAVKLEDDGRKKGNFQSRIRAAVERLEHIRRRRQAHQEGRKLRVTGDDAADRTGALARLSAASSGCHGFATPRAANTLADPGADEG